MPRRPRTPAPPRPEPPPRARRGGGIGAALPRAAMRRGRTLRDAGAVGAPRGKGGGHALPLLRVNLIASLVLLIAVSIASYRDVEQLVQDQRALNAAYGARARLQDARTAVREAQAAQAAFSGTGSPADRARRDDRLAAARRDLDDLPAGLPADLSAARAGALLAGAAGAAPPDAAYSRALALARQAADRETSDIAARSGRVEAAAAREREYVWVRTCGMVALLGVAFLLFWRDTAQRERQEQELRLANRALARLAEQDGLTRLKNRRALEERMRAEWGRACRCGDPLSLVFVDVDRFKQYNDSFGHVAGDEVLRKVAGLLKSESRASDFVARYGGEEFAVLLPGTGESEARRQAERLRSSFESATWPGRPVTASVGVATLSPDTADALDTLLYEADVALYFAKHNGRNRVAHAGEVVKIK